MSFVVTIFSEVVKRFDNLCDCKDFIFMKHCFDGIPKHAMKVFDSKCNVVPMWTSEAQRVW